MYYYYNKGYAKMAIEKTAPMMKYVFISVKGEQQWIITSQ